MNKEQKAEHVSLLVDLDNGKNCSAEAAAAIRDLEQRIAELEKTITTISGGVSTSRIAELEAENKALRDRLKDAYRWNAITGDYRRVLQEQGK